MRYFEDTFKTRKQSFVGAFSIWVTVPWNENRKDASDYLKRLLGFFVLFFDFPNRKIPAQSYK